MPSVCPKSAEKISTPPDGESSLSGAIAIVEKKVRNLEKRKLKLDGYRADQDRGKTLNEDQKAAIGKYGEVIGSLDFARELSGQFTKLMQDEEKERKKMLKKENHERARAELSKVTYVLSARELFTSLQDAAIMADFKDGTNGATKLTADQLKQLAEFQLVSTPSREDVKEESFEMQVATSAEHLVNLAEKKDRKVVGTTYKDLAELIDTIRQSGYFETKPEVEETAEEEVAKEEEVEVESAEEACEENGGDEEVVVVANGVAKVGLEETVTAAMLGHASPTRQQPEEQAIAANPPPQQPLPMFPPAVPSPPAAIEPNPTASSNEPRGPELVPTEAKPVAHESLNFFQESQIDLGSPHMDPAVVMVHGQQAAAFAPQKPPTGPPSLSNAHLLAQEQQQQHRNNPGMPLSIPTQTFTNQMYQGMPQPGAPQGHPKPPGVLHQPAPVMGHVQENGAMGGQQNQVVVGEKREQEFKQIQAQVNQHIAHHQMGDPVTGSNVVPRPNNGQMYPQENFNQAQEVAAKEELRARKEKEQSVPRAGGYAAMAAGGPAPVKQTPDSEIGQWNPEGQGGGNNG